VTGPRRGAKGGGAGRATAGSPRRYSRSARVNEVLRETIATELERRADVDDRLALLTVTAVDCDRDLRHATVLLSSLSDEMREILEELRARLQAAVAAEVRLKWTPQLDFAADPAVASGQRVEEILRDLRSSGDDGDSVA